MIAEPLCNELHDEEIAGFADRIKALGYTQERFAARINRRQENLSRWFTGKVRMTIRNFNHVKNHLGKLERVQFDKMQKATTLKK